MTVSVWPASCDSLSGGCSCFFARSVRTDFKFASYGAEEVRAEVGLDTVKPEKLFPVSLILLLDSSISRSNDPLGVPLTRQLEIVVLSVL